MHIISSHLYAEFGRYIDTLRAIPKDIDCLLPVQRRLLLTLHQAARKKFEKSAKIVGLCLAYHPHGDASTYEALVKMVQRGYVIGKGGWGIPGWNDSPAASMRYTECKANEKIDSRFSQYLKYVPWEFLEVEKEPLYLPSPIPIGLVGEGITVGIGFHFTCIPRYREEDLITRLLELLDGEPKTIIQPQVKHCQIRESKLNKDFESILKTGEGTIQITPNHKRFKNKIVFTGIHPINKFTRLKTANERHEQEHGVPLFDYRDTWNRKCSTPIEVEIMPIGSRATVDNVFYEDIISKAQSNVNVKIYVVDNDLGVVRKKSIDELLLLSFSKWKEAKLASMKEDLYNVQLQIEELKVVKIIQDAYVNNPTVKMVSDLIKIIKSNGQVTIPDKVISDIANRYSIRKLIEWNTDIKPLQQKLKDIQRNIDNIDTVARNAVAELYK